MTTLHRHRASALRSGTFGICLALLWAAVAYTVWSAGTVSGLLSDGRTGLILAVAGMAGWLAAYLVSTYGPLPVGRAPNLVMRLSLALSTVAAAAVVAGMGLAIAGTIG